MSESSPLQPPHPSGGIRDFPAGAVSAQYRAAQPTHFFCLDDFLTPELARDAAAAFPSFGAAVDGGGKRFERVNEDVKVQLTDAERFPPPVRRLHELLASASFLARMSEVTGIPNLVADPALQGGGMHIMGPSGYLGVHVDFNFLREEKLFRRLNILVYLTPGWQSEWGGEFELWDPKVRQRLECFEPRFNRCFVFNTTDRSFHGVNAIRCPGGVTRNSFAAFYYTAEPPPGWNGRHHSTIYKARPDEWAKRFVHMPLDATRRAAERTLRRARRLKRQLLG